MDLPTRIKSWRKHFGLTQAALAERMEKFARRHRRKRSSISSAAVAQWETGDTEPTHESLQWFVDTVGITMERFYGTVPPETTAVAS